MIIEKDPFLMDLPDVEITYCAEWDLLSRATLLATRIQHVFGFPVRLTPLCGGVFKVAVDGEVVIDNGGAFCHLPHTNAILQRIAEAAGRPEADVHRVRAQREQEGF